MSTPRYIQSDTIRFECLITSQWNFFDRFCEVVLPVLAALYSRQSIANGAIFLSVEAEALRGTRSTRKPCLFLLLVLLLFAGRVFAQVVLNTGSIYGVVSNQTGAGLPGVTITLEGEGMGAKIEHSGNAGVYRFFGLPPALYSLKFSLQGQTTVDEKIRVIVGRTVELRVVMADTPKEEVTISGEAALVETRRISTSTSFNQQFLSSVPTSRDPWSVLAQVPGIDVSRINVGGTSSGQQADFIARGGSFFQNVYSYDRIDITDPVGGAPAYFDFDSFEEIEVTTGGMDPALNSGGVVINFVTKRSGDHWGAQGSGYFTNNDLQGDNIDRELSAQHFVSPTKIDQAYEYGLDAGGPVLKDRLWLWGAYRFQDISNISSATRLHDTGVDRLDGSIAGLAPILFKLTNYNLKANLAYDAKNEGNFQFVQSRKQQFGRFVFPPSEQSMESTENQDGTTRMYRAEHTWSPNSNWFLDGRFAYLDGLYTFLPKAGRDSQPVFRLNNDFFLENGFVHLNVDEPQTNVTFDANYFRQNGWGGDHEFKFGFSYRHSGYKGLIQYGGDLVLYDYTGARGDQSLGAGIAKVQYPFDVKTHSGTFGAYAGDTWRSKRVTLNAGLRFVTSSTGDDAISTPANAVAPDLLPALSFSGKGTDVRFNDLSPRFGMTCDLTGNGTTIVRGNYARFYDVADLIYSFFQTPLGGYTGVYTYYADNNGDGVITRDEIDSSYLRPYGGMLPGDAEGTVSGFPHTRFIDSNLKPQSTDEFLIGFERLLSSDVSVSATYTRRKYDQIQDTYIPDVTSSDYVCNPLTVINPATGQIFETVDCKLPSGIPDRTELLNTNGRTRSYDGLEMALSKRMSSRWMLRVSATIQSQKLHYANNSTTFGGSYQDPTNIAYTNGKWWASDTTGNLGSNWGMKVSGAYQFPHNITVGAYFQLKNGYIVPLTRRGSFGNYGLYAEGNHKKLVAPTDSVRLDPAPYMDLKIEKGFSMKGHGRLTVSADIFNIFNINTVQALEGNVQTFQFMEPQDIVSPRVLRLGLRFNY